MASARTPHRAPWPAAAYAADAARIGAAMHALVNTEPRWIHRRVETVEVLGHEIVRRNVSVDFTLPDRLASRVVLTYSKGHLVPVAVLRKLPLRNFDCRLGPSPVPVLGRQANAMIAGEVLATSALRALARAKRKPPSMALRETLASVARNDEPLARAAVARLAQAAARGDVEARAVLEDDRSAFMIRTLASNYLLVVELREVDHRQVVKFGYDDRPRRSRAESLQSAVAQALGWRPLIVQVDTPSASRAASYHVEVVVPEETRVTRALLWDAASRTIYDIDRDAERAALLTSGVSPAAAPRLVFGLAPERTGFPAVSFAISVITTGLLAIGAIWGNLNPAQAGPPAALLLAGSALFAGAVARSGEHRLLRALYAWPRRLLMLVALSALAAAASLAYDGNDDVVCVVWTAAAVVSAVASAGLALMFRNARPTFRS